VCRVSSSASIAPQVRSDGTVPILLQRHNRIRAGPGKLERMGVLGGLGVSLLALAAWAQPPAASGGPARAAGCLADGSGYFRAHVRGAMNVDLNWHNAELECAGEERPGAGGVRLTFAGPLRGAGRRLRFVFGVSEAASGSSSGLTLHALPTNLTVIVEGAQRLFSTRGDDKCTVDSLREEPLGPPGSAGGPYRVVARGFCTAPASGITRNERIIVTRFDFAGRIVLTPRALSSPR
jgi:hypothetical protein